MSARVLSLNTLLKLLSLTLFPGSGCERNQGKVLGRGENTSRECPPQITLADLMGRQSDSILCLSLPVLRCRVRWLYLYPRGLESTPAERIIELWLVPGALVPDGPVVPKDVGHSEELSV
jgi:hypothetical protein